MTDPAESVGLATEKLGDGYLEIGYGPVGGGKIRLVAFADGEPLESGEFSPKVFSSRTLKGQFLNSVQNSLEGHDVDAEKARTALKEWFAVMDQLDKEEQSDLFLTDEIQQIIENTVYPVEIHGGETTTWHVTLTFGGRTAELEFTAAEMTGNGAPTLEEKIANQFFEIVEIAEEDWEAIRDRWHEQSEVTSVVSETASDAVADRVLSKLSTTVMPVADRENLGNDTAAAWYDSENTTAFAGADMDAAILWVQDDFLVDQMESAGQQVEYKSGLVKDLIARGDVYGPNKRKRWVPGRRSRFYPFDPDSLGVTQKDVGDVDTPNHSEVSAE
jgi:hypothetical protein